MTRPCRRVVAAACVLIGMTLAGCSSPVTGHASNAAPSPVSSGSAAGRHSAVPQQTTTPAALGTALEHTAIQATDVAAGYKLQLMPSGDQVTGQVTLDNCGYRFTTEADRVARRQYGIITADGHQTGVSNEVVVYSSAAQAAKALSEWVTAAAHCPRTPVHSTVAGVPNLLETVTRNDVNVTGLPVRHNAVTTETATAQGKTLNTVAVLQTEGRILDNIYAASATPLTAQSLASVMQLAQATGQRLAAQP